MRGGTNRVGTGIGAIIAMAVVLLLLPAPSGLSLAGHAIAATASGSDRTASHGQSVELPSVAHPTWSGGFAGTTTLLGSRAGAATHPGPASMAPRPAVTGPPKVLSRFAGVTESTAGGYYPPDTQVAENGIYVFELVNEYGQISSLNGSTAYSSFTTQAFFNTTSTDNVGDVQVLFDAVSHRWFVTADDFTTNVEHVGVSTSVSPVGTYYRYFYTITLNSAQAQFMDQPVLGISKSLVGISTNQFNTTTFAFYGSAMAVFDKTLLESGTYSAQGLGFPTLGSLHPAREITTNGSGTDVLYAASTGVFSGSTTLSEVEITGPIGNLTTGQLNYGIANTGTVPSALQKGTLTGLATGDDRVQSVSWSITHILWISFSTGCRPMGDLTTRSCVRVDAIATAGNVLKQDATMGISGKYLFYPAVTALSAGKGYLMIFGESGATQYPSVLIAGQNTTDPYGTHRGPTLVFTGSASDLSGRFGDFSGIQLQQIGTRATAWGATEYDTSTGWATEIVHWAFY